MGYCDVPLGSAFDSGWARRSANGADHVGLDVDRLTGRSITGSYASAMIDRADAVAEKQRAPNIIDVQPLSEIITRGRAAGLVNDGTSDFVDLKKNTLIAELSTR
jgi:hypothetical protein